MRAQYGTHIRTLKDINKIEKIQDEQLDSQITAIHGQQA